MMAIREGLNLPMSHIALLIQFIAFSCPAVTRCCDYNYRPNVRIRNRDEVCAIALQIRKISTSMFVALHLNPFCTSVPFEGVDV